MSEQHSYVRYRDDVEELPPDEDQTTDRIIASMRRTAETTAGQYGHAVRTSHAKSHGLLKGEMRVLDNLPEPLRQGLFATPRSYPAIVRMANVPGEILDDSVTTQRGLSIKVLDVQGPMLPGHMGEVTQDFVLDTGTRFANAGAAGLLATMLGLEQAPKQPQTVKTGVSKASRAANAALEAVGSDSATLDFLGHPPRHPLAEAYFTQAPIRYGDHIAKLGVFPASQGLASLPDIDPSKDPDALRTATVAYFRQHPAEFEVRVQLCTDLGRMPAEDASAEWPQEESPYQPVARLVLPVQDAYSPPRRA